jgi:LysM repeat protein
MSSNQQFSRRRVFVKRVASICGMSVVLPLLGCGSFSSPFDVASRGAGEGFGASAKAPKTDYVDGYSQVLSSGTYVPASVERKGLAPVSAPAQKVAAADTSLSGGYALGSVQYEGDPGPAPRREAANYGQRRPSQPYAGGQSDFDEADQARRGDYAQGPRYPQVGPGEAGGDYVVQPGDTLYAVAVRHGTTVDELIAINHLRGADIYAGQRLRLGAGGGYEGKPYAEPRPYREPGGLGGGEPYRERQADRRGEYPAPPTANVYQERFDGPKTGQRYDGPDGYDQQRAPYRPSYPSEPQGPRERGYDESRGISDRATD